MHLRLPQVPQLRGLVATMRRRRYAVPAAAGTLAVVALTTVTAVALGSSSGQPAGRVTPSMSPSFGAVSAPTFDLDEFRDVARAPAAAAPIKHLPKVDTATITVTGIPLVALRAYRSAARQLAQTSPGCQLSWWLIAGIGLVESGHAASGGSRQMHWDGVARPPIFGPRLDGSHDYLAVHDTDDGRYDRDTRWDRAVGPMQFLPSTWRRWGPAVGSGLASPQNIRAAAVATAGYLCAGGLDLSQPHAMALAVYSYNHSFDYVRLVLAVAARYAGMSPADLGVDRLPHDRDVKTHRARHRSDGAHRTSDEGTVDAATSPSAAPAPASASPSPTPTPSSASTGGPIATVSPTAVPTILPSLSVG